LSIAATLRLMQQRLGIPADGQFGPGTERALEAFQSHHGLTADGLLGPATRQALGLPAGAILRPNAAYFVHKRVKPVHHVTHHVTHHAQSTRSSGYAIPSQVVQCESGGNPSAVSPYSGGGLYGILDSSWQAYGGTAYAPHPYDASASQQGAIARKILASQGPGAWQCWK
jgi:Transglycosylase-like domain/Putative peptidoglycan binding domain